MTAQLLSSKIVIQEEEPSIRPIAGVETAIPGFTGICERGPMSVATLITSPDDYKRLYGGYTASGEVAQAVDGYFGNGGQKCYVSRNCHYTDPSDPTTKTAAIATKTVQTGATGATAAQSIASSAGPYDLEPGQTIVCAIDGGADLTATLAAVAAQRDSSGAWPKVLSNGLTLLISIDGGAVQTIAFLTAEFVAIGAATAAEVAAVIAAKIVGASVSVVGGQVRIKSDKRGTASSVNVSGGTANAGLLAYTTGLLAGTGNVANIDAVTATEIVALITTVLVGAVSALVGGKPAITSSTTGGASSVIVKGTSTAVAIGFDNATHSGLTGAAINTLRFDGKTEGTYANAITPVIENATSGEAARFNVRMVRAGVTLETFPNLSMDNTDANFVETVINNATTGSVYMSVTDLAAATPAPNDRPANGTYTLTGGNDGLAGLVDNDFIGGSGPNGKTGMRAFDLAQDITLIATPGRATSAMHNAMIAYCEVTRDQACFAVLDPPSNTSAEGMVTYVDTTAAIRELSEFAAIYWPRIKVANPSSTIFGTSDTLVVAPSGYVCGVMARNDAKRDGGVYDAPAGTELGVVFGCLGFETNDVLEEAKRDLIYPKRINPITTSPGLPRYIDGSRTLKSTGNFPSVSERRGVIFIEQSIKAALQFARHRNNDETLRAEVSRSVEGFLTLQMKQRAFRSQDPAKAFFVDFGATLNTDAVAFAGKLIGRIGLATQKPAEFIVLRFSQFVSVTA